LSASPRVLRAAAAAPGEITVIVYWMAVAAARPVRSGSVKLKV
jgi:hypothetical protein